MIPVKPYSQNDASWKRELLGSAPASSKITIGSDGCALTCAAMVGNYLSGKDLTPSQLNEELKKRNGYARNKQGYKVLVIWSVVAQIYGIKFVKTASYNNVSASYLVYVKGTPLIVEGPAPEIGAIQHFRVFVGDRKQVDPLTGQIISTQKYETRSVREFARS